jgi:hypothetical protein
VRSLAAASLRVVLTALVVTVVVWSVAAVWIDGPKNRELAGMLCVVVGAGSLLLLLVVQPWWWSLATALVPFVVVLAWWLSIAPSNDRDWQADVARLPSATIAGDRVTIRNVRNFAYPSAGAVVERWETRSYDLGRIDGFDMFLSYWGPKIIAHTISSWQFSDGQHLAISIETRKKNGQDYSPVLGFFRQFELYYVVADERDVIGLRTNHRGEDTYLYHLRTPVSHARALLLDYFAVINELAAHPRFYDALTQNCTTTIRMHQRQTLKTLPPFDWRMIVNGYGDQMLYERGMIDTSLPFDELKRRSRIVERAHAAEGAADFGTRIREGLPVPAPTGDPTGP